MTTLFTLLGDDHWADMDHPYQHYHHHYSHRDIIQVKAPRPTTTDDVSFSSIQPVWSSSVNVPSVDVRDFLHSSDCLSSVLDLDLDTDDGQSSTVSHADTASEVASIIRSWEASQVLDPTSIEAGFDFDCLDCIGDGPLHDPHGAFTELCWSEAVSNYHDRPRAPTPRAESPSSPCSPASPDSLKTPLDLPPPAYAEFRGSMDLEVDSPRVVSFESELDRVEEMSDPRRNDDDDDADDDVFFRHDEESRFTRKPSTVYHLNDKTSFVIFDPPSLPSRFPDAIGYSPVANRPLPPLPRKNLSKRLASFCTKIVTADLR